MRECCGKLMWLSPFPLIHIAALCIHRLAYGPCLIPPYLPWAPIGESQHLTGNLSIGLGKWSDRGWNCREGWSFAWLSTVLLSLLGGRSDLVPVAWQGCPKPLIYISIDYCAKKWHNCPYRSILHLRQTFTSPAKILITDITLYFYTFA